MDDEMKSSVLPISNIEGGSLSASSDSSSAFEISSPSQRTSTFNGNERTRSPIQKSNPTIFSTSNTEPENSGKPCVDFIYELGEKVDFWLIVSKIFSYLRPEDLCAVALVSPTWYKVCCKDRIANRKRRRYIRSKNMILENIPLLNNVKRTPADRQFSVGNGVFSQIQSLSIGPSFNSTPRSPAVSPTKVRFHLFYKEGRKLGSGEGLSRCPRCSLPAHVTPSLRRGLCSRRGCQFAFCSRCHCEFHGATPCHRDSATILHNATTGIVGSKASRRNLRKLL